MGYGTDDYMNTRDMKDFKRYSLNHTGAAGQSMHDTMQGNTLNMRGNQSPQHTKQTNKRMFKKSTRLFSPDASSNITHHMKQGMTPNNQTNTFGNSKNVKSQMSTNYKAKTRNPSACGKRTVRY